MRTNSPTEIYRVQQLKRNLVFYIQQEISFSYDFDAVFHVISQINGTELFEKGKYICHCWITVFN